MTGPEIRRLRRGIELEPFAFAKVLGVHPSTLYRWEQTAGQVRMDPLQREILDKLAERLRAAPKSEKRELGDAVLKALLAGGVLLGLGALIGKIVGDDRNGD